MEQCKCSRISPYGQTRNTVNSELRSLFQRTKVVKLVFLPQNKGPSINDVMPEGGGGVRVRMTNNVEGCIKNMAGGGGRLKNAPK